MVSSGSVKRPFTLLDPSVLFVIEKKKKKKGGRGFVHLLFEDPVAAFVHSQQLFDQVKTQFYHQQEGLVLICSVGNGGAKRN